MPGHPQARAASRSFLCAERQRKGDAMAEALFAAPDLTPEACAQLAAAAGMSQGEYRACVSDPELDMRLDATVAWVKDASPRGLPVVWVQDQMLFGEQSYGTLRDAVEEAEAHLQGTPP
jgi:2-hydroxychromene-2-carboxylate isomerase